MLVLPDEPDFARDWTAAVDQKIETSAQFLFSEHDWICCYACNAQELIIRFAYSRTVTGAVELPFIL